MKTETIKAVAAALALAAFGTATADVSCRVEPDYAVRLADKAGDAYVKVTLAADRVVAANRPSVNLAIVLDRSGSMHGDKIVKAREAACEAIRRLDAKDIVSVVAYDNKSEVIIPAQHVTEKEALIARISAIEPRGCTALFDGVSAGATELRKFKGKCEISRVLLLSDGQANVGPSSPDELGRYGALLMKDGIAVSTIGLGVDYNEDLMTRLSQKSDGNSYFVENSNDLPRVFARELGDVLSVAATKVALKRRALRRRHEGRAQGPVLRRLRPRRAHRTRRAHNGRRCHDRPQPALRRTGKIRDREVRRRARPGRFRPRDREGGDLVR